MSRVYTQTELDKIRAVYHHLRRRDFTAADAIVDAMTDEEFDALVASCEALDRAFRKGRVAGK